MGRGYGIHGDKTPSVLWIKRVQGKIMVHTIKRVQIGGNKITTELLGKKSVE